MSVLYSEIMEGKKKLGILTLGAVFFVFLSATITHFAFPKQPLNTKSSFPSFGRSNAPIEVVLIEDFQCKNCRAFSKKLIPNLQKSYIQSGKVRFTLVPVSFLRGSQLIANAALEVYTQNPKQFFPFLRGILEHEGDVRKSDLIRIARRLGGINLQKLQHCMDTGCHNKELDKNLTWAQSVMGAQFRTPALYVNGDIGSTYSFEAVKYQIEKILGNQ